MACGYPYRVTHRKETAGAQMLKCVIFNMDGTIANTLPLCITAFRKSVRALSGANLTDRQITNAFGPSEEGVIAALLPEHYDEAINRYLEYYEAFHPILCPHPFYGIPRLFFYLWKYGLKVAVVTGKGERSLGISMRILGISRSWFQRIETGSPEGSNKADGIRRVLKALSIRPDEAVYIGDSVYDIDAAREVSVPIVSAAWSPTSDADELHEHAPDYLFQSVQSLTDRLISLCEFGQHRLVRSRLRRPRF